MQIISRENVRRLGREEAVAKIYLRGEEYPHNRERMCRYEAARIQQGAFNRHLRVIAAKLLVSFPAHFRTANLIDRVWGWLIEGAREGAGAVRS